jgi:hypothetical protein
MNEPAVAKPMSRGERAELGQLIRKREKVMKSKAAERSAQMLADFDAATAKIYHFDEDAVWAEAQREAQSAIDSASAMIAARCLELGIPAEFAPGLTMYWHGRGQNAVRDRRVEMRRAAKSRIDAIEKEAISKIERLSLEAQTEVLANGLESEAARSFLNTLPPIEKMMPTIEVREVEQLIEAKHKQGRLPPGYGFGGGELN